MIIISGDNISRDTLTKEDILAIENSQWLTDRQRLILNLRYKRGWKQEDIAAEIDVSRKTIYRELKKIRSLINVP